MKNFDLKPLLFASCLLSSATSFASLSGAGNAYDFESSSITVPYEEALSLSDAMSLEAWINPDAHQEQVILSQGEGIEGRKGYELKLNAQGNLVFGIATKRQWLELQSIATVEAQTWNHVAVTVNQQQIKLYVNGVLQGSVSHEGTFRPAEENLLIGATSNGYHFDGQIDEVRVWNAPLNQLTIRDYMCRKLSTRHPDYETLSVHFNLDELSGQTIQDQSANGLSGQIQEAKRIPSTAPLGDISMHTYAAEGPLMATFSGRTKDAMRVDVLDNESTVHLYLVDQDNGDDSHYYGVFNPSNASYGVTVRYNSTAVNGIQERHDAGTTWNEAPAVLDQRNRSILMYSSESKEYMLANVATAKENDTEAESWKANLSIAPNPTSNELQIRLHAEVEMLDIRVLDAQGRVVLTKTMSGNYETIDTSELPEGIYFVQLIDQQTQIAKRFVKH